MNCYIYYLHTIERMFVFFFFTLVYFWIVKFSFQIFFSHSYFGGLFCFILCPDINSCSSEIFILCISMRFRVQLRCFPLKLLRGSFVLRGSGRRNLLRRNSLRIRKSTLYFLLTCLERAHSCLNTRASRTAISIPFNVFQYFFVPFLRTSYICTIPYHVFVPISYCIIYFSSYIYIYIYL